MDVVPIIFFVTRFAAFTETGFGNGAIDALKFGHRVATGVIVSFDEFVFDPIVVRGVGLDLYFAVQGAGIAGVMGVITAVFQQAMKNNTAVQMIFIDITGKTAVMPLRNQQSQSQIMEQSLHRPLPAAFACFHLQQFAHKRHIRFGDGERVKNFVTQTQICVWDLAGTAVQRLYLLLKRFLFLCQFIFSDLREAEFFNGRFQPFPNLPSQFICLLTISNKRSLICIPRQLQRPRNAIIFLGIIPFTLLILAGADNFLLQFTQTAASFIITDGNLPSRILLTQADKLIFKLCQPRFGSLVILFSLCNGRF